MISLANRNYNLATYLFNPGPAPGSNVNAFYQGALAGPLVPGLGPNALNRYSFPTRTILHALIGRVGMIPVVMPFTPNWQLYF